MVTLYTSQYMSHYWNYENEKHVVCLKLSFETNNLYNRDIFA